MRTFRRIVSAPVFWLIDATLWRLGNVRAPNGFAWEDLLKDPLRGGQAWAPGIYDPAREPDR